MKWLGYSGYAHRRRPGGIRNPLEVLLRALSIEDLDPRLLEALPWLLLRFGAGDHRHLVERARFLNLQNRLGFTVALAEQLAKRQGTHGDRAGEMRELLASLEPSRLAREDTWGRPPRTEQMRKWLRQHRSATAAHWNILSDLVPEHLSHGP